MFLTYVPTTLFSLKSKATYLKLFLVGVHVFGAWRIKKKRELI